jgi:XRE family transcriptional regulator, fatty acid utilization regulator
MDQATVRRRLQLLRERRKETLEDLAYALGLKDHQTLSDIELGKREIASEELVEVAAHFGVSPDYFTDPLELAGEAMFSWRRDAANGNDIGGFEALAGRWIATYRYLCLLKGDPVNSSLTRVNLSTRSSFEDAANEGDAVSRTLKLGDVPSAKLAEVLESKCDTLVLLIDTWPGISGAACQFGSLNTILVNRKESIGRRSFDMGHELFHLLTWANMPPPHVEGASDQPKLAKRIEQLADNFASGLLMPLHVINSRLERSPMPGKDGDIAGWLCEHSSALGVSGAALKWRLVCLGKLKNSLAAKISDDAVKAHVGETPPQFSRRFVEVLWWGLEQGILSARRAAKIVSSTVDELADIFTAHELDAPFVL